MMSPLSQKATIKQRFRKSALPEDDPDGELFLVDNPLVRKKQTCLPSQDKGPVCHQDRSHW